MGDFVARKLKELPAGHEFIASNFFGKEIGIVEPERRGELIAVSLDGTEVLSWWPEDTEVVITA